MADSSTDLTTSTDQEMITIDQTDDVSPPDEQPTKAPDAEELKKAISDDSAKVNNEVEEEEEYVLKDEAHEEEDNQKDPETNGKEHEEDEKEKKGDERDKREEKSEKSSEKSPGKSLGATVAKHYNSVPEAGRDARRQSRIFHLRNFNNWVKSVLIHEFLEKAKKIRRRYDEEINVLDLGCGKGGDLLKWQQGRVGHVICADIAETSVQQCRERYNNMRKAQRQGGYRESRERLFSIECFPADCTKVDISKKFRSGNMQLDLSSCQFAFHYSFESYEQADMMLKNACEHLRPGGYFIGTTPDANQLLRNLKKAEGNSFGNDIYTIEFDSKDNFALFGTKYHFNLVDVVDCPEFLVHFKTVEKLAEKYNMKLVFKKNFKDLFNDSYKDYGSLLHKMQALEPYPARRGWNLVSDKESDYAHIKEHEDEVNSGREKVLGTLTKDEWDAAGLYIAFAFEKIDTEEIAKQEQKEKAAKRSAPSENKQEDCEPPVKRTKESEDMAEKESKAQDVVVEDSKVEEVDEKESKEENAVDESKAEDVADQSKADDSQMETQNVAAADTEIVQSAETSQTDTADNQASSEEQVPIVESTPAEEPCEQPQEEKMEEDAPAEQTEEQTAEQAAE